MGEPVERARQDDTILGVFRESVEEIASIAATLNAGPIDQIGARRVCERFAALRRQSVEGAYLDLAELAFSGELVFDALSRRAVQLTDGEIGFLHNVMGALREIVDAGGSAPRSGSMELVNDAFDRLLRRVEPA